MSRPPSPEEVASYFKQFEEVGESQVRVAVESFLWENEGTRRSMAKEWLRLKDEARADANISATRASESRAARWARHAAYAAYAAATIAAIGAYDKIVSTIGAVMSWLQ